MNLVTQRVPGKHQLKAGQVLAAARDVCEQAAGLAGLYVYNSAWQRISSALILAPETLASLLVASRIERSPDDQSAFVIVAPLNSTMPALLVTGWSRHTQAHLSNRATDARSSRWTGRSRPFVVN